MERLGTVAAPRGEQRGMTLIETMIAMVVLLLTLLALLSVVPFSFNNVQANALQVQAVSLGQQYLDDQRNAKLFAGVMPAATTSPIDTGQSFVNNGQAAKNYGNFTITPDGCASVADTGTGANQVSVFSCSVVVSWTENGAGKSVTVQSYVAK
jgi:prepilin-type N-terminal cleavage/methylation domain-containing protein